MRPARGPTRRRTRRGLLKGALIAGAGSLLGPMLNLGRCRLDAGVVVSTRAVDLVGRSPVVDMLGLLTLDWSRLYGWGRAPESFGAGDFRALSRTGVKIFHPAIEVPGTDRHVAVRRWLELWRKVLSSHYCYLAPIATIDDLLALPSSGRLGVLVGFQNSDHFRRPEDVEIFHRLGQRVSQLTYNERNRLGSGCRATPDRGLTPFGAQIVAEMNRVGMAVDVSHCGDRTAIEAIRASRRPVLITHSNCRALVPGQARCMPDSVIRELASRGGVMGVTVVSAFVARRNPSIENVLDHIDHIARLVGIEHAGIGSDVDVEGRDPASGRPLPYYEIAGLHLPSRVFQIADGLLRRGYGESDVELVLGRNFQRALANIWSDGDWWPPQARDRDPFCPVGPPHPR